MSSLPALHHVYSSIKGYKTLYMSYELKPIQSRIEEYSRGVAGLCTEGRMFNTFIINDVYRCYSRVFQAGVDYFGRPRHCMHTIFVRRAYIAGIPFMPPLAFEVGNFIDPATNLQDLGAHSFADIALQPDQLEAAFDALTIEALDFPGAAGLYKALVAARADATVYAIIGAPADIQNIARLLAIVPRTVTQDLNVFYNYDVTGTAFCAEGIRLCLYPSRNKRTLPAGTPSCVNLVTGEETDIRLDEEGEQMTVDNLWSETDMGRRRANLADVKDYLKQLDLRSANAPAETAPDSAEPSKAVGSETFIGRDATFGGHGLRR
ncbi:MAG: hypothetical protein ABIF71_05720 [Planctomycetota bacterium]